MTAHHDTTPDDTTPAAEVALPETREALMVLHRAARRRRDTAPDGSHERAEAMAEVGRIEVQIARVERAMQPPRV